MISDCDNDDHLDDGVYWINGNIFINDNLCYYQDNNDKYYYYIEFKCCCESDDNPIKNVKYIKSYGEKDRRY